MRQRDRPHYSPDLCRIRRQRQAPFGKQARLFAAGGSTKSGGVWFSVANPAREFIVAEGIESTLSAMRIHNATSGCAALSEGGIRALILPPEARLVRIFADHDEGWLLLAELRPARSDRLGMSLRKLPLPRPRLEGQVELRDFNDVDG